jgi:hypothetical protein
MTATSTTRANDKSTNTSTTHMLDLQALNKNYRDWQGRRTTTARRALRDANLVSSAQLPKIQIDKLESKLIRLIDARLMISAANEMASHHRQFVIDYLIKKGYTKLEIQIALFVSAGVFSYKNLALLIQMDIFDRRDIQTISDRIDQQLTYLWETGQVDGNFYQRIGRVDLMKVLLGYLGRTSLGLPPGLLEENNH